MNKFVRENNSFCSGKSGKSQGKCILQSSRNHVRVSSILWQNFFPLGAGGPHEWGRERGTPPLKFVILPLLAHLTWKWLQIGTGMLLIITSTGDELLRDVNIDDLEWPWTPKIGGFSEIFCDFRLQHAFQEWIVLKWLEVVQDNLHMKFLAFNVDFSNLSLDPLGSRRPAHVGVKEGFPF